MFQYRMPRLPHKMIHSKAGFSLLEMLIVLSFIGVLLAFSAPALLNLRTTGLTTSGREFGNFLGLCRSEAIAGRTSVRLGNRHRIARSGTQVHHLCRVEMEQIK